MSEKAAKRFDLATQARICAVCPNMCRFLCPVAAVEKIETVTPRGKAQLAVAVERGEIPLSPETAGVFYHCATCKVCREWCPSGVDLPEVTGGLRRRAAREGLAPVAARTLTERLLRDRSLYLSPVEAGGRLSRYRELLTPGAKVLYFAGCSTAALHPEIVGATLRLFEAAGVKVAMLETEQCCGLPLDVLGYRDEAAGLARDLAEAVAAGGYETVVSGCPMCTYVFKEIYPVLGARLGAEVKHVTEFFFGLHEDGALVKLGRKHDLAVTYHDPCYLGRYQDVFDAPRRLLSDVAGLRLLEMESNRGLAACCGGAPATDAAVPGTATAIGARRAAEARRTGADLLVTACPHCLDMLGPAAGSGDGPPAGPGDGPPVRDISEVLAERFGVLPRR